jgi:hypothetical protein
MTTRKTMFGLLVLAALALATNAQAQLIKNWKDLDVNNKNSGIRQGGRDLDKSIPRFNSTMGRTSGSGWSDGQNVSYTIDPYGNVTRFLDGTNPSNLGRVANLNRNAQGQAFWNYNGVTVRAAPQFDQTANYQIQIDPNNGAVIETKYVGTQIVNRQQVGWAQLCYAGNGQPLFRWGSNQVAANRPWQQAAGGQNNQQQDPGMAIANGVIQIINSAAQAQHNYNDYDDE